MIKLYKGMGCAGRSAVADINDFLAKNDDVEIISITELSSEFISEYGNDLLMVYKIKKITRDEIKEADFEAGYVAGQESIFKQMKELTDNEKLVFFSEIIKNKFKLIHNLIHSNNEHIELDDIESDLIKEFDAFMSKKNLKNILNVCWIK